MRQNKSNISIIGGGAIGSSIAYFLATADPTVSITVFERDPTYTYSSSTLSAASIRQQFSTSLSIQMSQFGIDFFRNIGNHLEVNGIKPVIDLYEGGYLFLATANELPCMLANYELYKKHRVDVELLDPSRLHARFPWLHTDDLAAGSLGLSGEGWFDGYSLVQSLKKKAQSLGVIYLTEDITELVRNKSNISHVVASGGKRYPCDLVVNAAGAWSRKIAQMADIELPVFARRRSVFNFSSNAQLNSCPLLVDPSGVYFRSEGNHFICGASPRPENDLDDLPLDQVDHALFDEVIWPTLAHRVPQFEALRVKNFWSGYYEYNTLDQNAIIGLHPDLDNFIFANGYSGHGIQHSPATGRGVSELILHNRYLTLDLSPFGFPRILENHPMLEQNVI